MKRKIYILAVIVIVGAVFFLFGRGLWHPVYVKIRGGTTVSAVVHDLRAKEMLDYDFEDWERIYILGFKEEQSLEIWATSVTGKKMWIKKYPFTGFSGSLGPKLREGDGQIPEGVYEIEYLNPNSSYHLSMKLSYPNPFDRDRGIEDGRDRLGDDIFIHGKSVTIGCIPIGDQNIEELFLMVAEVGIPNVEVIIAPYDMRDSRRAIEIDGIDWEHELYERIQGALEGFIYSANE